MVGVAKIGVLAASLGTQRRELGINERAEERDDAAGDPRAEDECGRMYLACDDIRLMKIPDPMMPPMTIIVASNAPSRRASVVMDGAMVT
ncbi:MAG TPA: hypothetical protein VGJ81_20440 [Thermoanaerobaculia bacterium]|jgi:hypothetical protein